MDSVYCHPVFSPLCIVILSLSLVSSLPNDVLEAQFYKLEGKSFIGNLTERHLAQDFWDCLFMCINTEKKDCYSYNFGGVELQGLFECELSNSEMKLEPEKIQDRQGFSYYGMTAESLYSYLPCASSPCLHGKECITRPIHGLYSCKCPLENIGMKFIDDKCSIDMKQIGKGPLMEGVQLSYFKGMSDSRLNFFDSEKLCKLLNASMASYDQLYAAWNAGLNGCLAAWINDSRVAYPRQTASDGCGNQVGIIVSLPQDKYNGRNLVWCHYTD